MLNQFLLFLVLFHSIIVSAQDVNNIHKENFENGNPKYEISYKNDLKHGKEIFWYESGHKKMESHFVNGVEEGNVVEVYDLTGRLVSAQELTDGQVELDVASGTYIVHVKNNDTVIHITRITK